MRYLLIYLLLIFFTPIYSQKIDNKLQFDDSLSIKKPYDAYLYYQNLLSSKKESISKEEQASLLSRLGQLNLAMGNYPEAIEQLSNAAQTFQQLGNEEALATQLSELGSAFYFSGFLDHSQALDYYNNANHIYDSLGLLNIATLNLNYSGYIHWAKGNKIKALKIHLKCAHLFDSLNYLKGRVISTSDAGFTLNSLNCFDDALKLNLKALNLSNKLKDNLVEVPILNNIGISYLGLGQLDSAHHFSQQSLSQAQLIKLKPRISEALNTLHQVYAAKNSYQMAYSYHQAYKDNQEKILHKDALRKLSKLENELLQAKTKIALKKEKHFRNILLILLLGVIIFSLLLWRIIVIRSRSAFRLKHKNNKLNELNLLVREQNVKLELKNDQISVKNKEVIDSINYAKRLQDAILPSKRMLDKSFSEYGLVYLPKDIVSGDFYWLKNTQNHIFFAVADCTGHGVPGALVSVVGNNALNQCVRELNLTDPAEILNNLTQIIEETFYKSSRAIKDGMDIALCVWDKKNTIKYAGAFNPLYHIRQNELSEIKANRRPIGNSIKKEKFKSHTISIKKGDSIFMFTDGYADQFGGERNKKLMYNRFKQYLIELNNKPIKTMKQTLIKRFNNWRGTNEQIDDVCILNVRF